MKRYDQEFKKEAIRKYLSGETIASISRETGVSANVLYRWKKAMVVDEDGEPDAEKLEMRKRIMELEMKCEILKKAALYFAKDG